MKAHRKPTRSAWHWLAAGMFGVALVAPAPSVQANSTVGAWATVKTLPYRPVHTVVLRTGR
jgi:hypothetical protein